MIVQEPPGAERAAAERKTRGRGGQRAAALRRVPGDTPVMPAGNVSVNDTFCIVDGNDDTSWIDSVDVPLGETDAGANVFVPVSDGWMTIVYVASALGGKPLVACTWTLGNVPAVVGAPTISSPGAS